MRRSILRRVASGSSERVDLSLAAAGSSGSLAEVSGGSRPIPMSGGSFTPSTSLSQSIGLDMSYEGAGSSSQRGDGMMNLMRRHGGPILLPGGAVRFPTLLSPGSITVSEMSSPSTPPAADHGLGLAAAVPFRRRVVGSDDVAVAPSAGPLGGGAGSIVVAAAAAAAAASSAKRTPLLTVGSSSFVTAFDRGSSSPYRGRSLSQPPLVICVPSSGGSRRRGSNTFSPRDTAEAGLELHGRSIESTDSFESTLWALAIEAHDSGATSRDVSPALTRRSRKTLSSGATRCSSSSSSSSNSVVVPPGALDQALRFARGAPNRMGISLAATAGGGGGGGGGGIGAVTSGSGRGLRRSPPSASLNDSFSSARCSPPLSPRMARVKTSELLFSLEL